MTAYILIRGEEAESSDDVCLERLTTVTKRGILCMRTAKATVIFGGPPPIRVCGVHARERERHMENVIWDATYDTPRGSRI